MSDYHTLLVRIDKEAAQKLRLIAARETTSMSQLVREAVDRIIKEKKELAK